MITKGTIDFADLDFQSGEVILIDKPSGWSSFKVIHNIRKSIGVKKVGHAGTLDPMATGLLIVCTGKKTKEITRYQALEKTYKGAILLGKTSPSMDLETEISSGKRADDLDKNDILRIKEEFTGEIYQIPPMYSAVKVGGKSLYKLARKGKTVDREPRRVFVSKFDIEIALPEIFFEIKCSKGTYIRVIADDFGKKLGCGGLLSSLRRTEIGEYSVDNALSVDEFISRINILPKFKEA